MPAAIRFAAYALAAAAWAGEGRVVWRGPGVNLLGGPSADGRLLSYVDGGDLAVRDLVEGTSRRLTNRAEGSGQFAYFSAISPDARNVAYAWFNDEGFYDLRVVPIDGGEPKILYRSEEAGFVQPCAWSPDGRLLLALLFRRDNISQIVLLPAGGGPPKVLRSLNWVYPKKMDFSPDGRFIAYDAFAREGTGERTIFVLAADGSRETRVVDGPGNHVFPLWSRDGKRIFFSSDREGTNDLWSIPIKEGKMFGKPQLAHRDLGRFLALGLTRTGDLFYGVRTGKSDVFVSQIDDPQRTAQRASIHFPGTNRGPSWSPDGKWLAYLSRRGSENYGLESRAIVLRATDKDEETEIAPKLAHIERVSWMADGKALLVSGSDNKGRAGLYRVAVPGGERQAIVEEAGADYRGFEGASALDGRVYFVQGNREVRAGSQIVYRGDDVRRIAVASDGKSIAVVDGSKIRELVAGRVVRETEFAGVTDLVWGKQLVAARGSELWLIEGMPRKLEMPSNLLPGFSLHPDGKRIALTAGTESAEIRVLSLAGQ